MLEMSVTQFFRLFLFGFLLVGIVLAIVVAVNSMLFSQQLQSAADLLSSTGGYMRTAQQQRQWWKLTHNPMFQVTEAHYTGITAADKKLGITSNKIDRGMPEEHNRSGVVSKYPTYQLSKIGKTRSLYKMTPLGSISAGSYDDAEAQANKTPGGIALNGPTGVHVNTRLMNDTIHKNIGYMQVPAHYGNKIEFTVTSWLPVHYFQNNGSKGTKVAGNTMLLHGSYHAQVASLRGNDQLYLDNQTDQTDASLNDAQDRGTFLLQLAGDQNGVDQQMFGYSKPGMALSPSSANHFMGAAQTLVQQWSDKLQNDKTTADIMRDAIAGLKAIDGLLQQNGGKFTDDSGTHVYTTADGKTNPHLVFVDNTGRQFTTSNIPNDFHYWPKEANFDSGRTIEVNNKDAN